MHRKLFHRTQPYPDVAVRMQRQVAEQVAVDEQDFVGGASGRASHRLRLPLDALVRACVLVGAGVVVRLSR